MINLVYYDSDNMMDTLIEKFEEGTIDPVTGEKVTVTDADYDTDIRAILYAMDYMGECLFNQINTEANNNLVAFCDEPNLIYKGMERNTYRLPAEYAQLTLQFTVSNTAPAAVDIPAGTKATADGSIIFQTVEDVTCDPGGTVEVLALSTEATKDANGYSIGSVNIIVNTIPYVTAVTNTTISSDGADIEDLEAFRERVLYAPLTYSCVGTANAYKFNAKKVSAAITDVAVTHDDNEIYVYLLCQGGSLPSQSLIDEVQAYLTQDNIKDTTDLIEVLPAEEVEYTVNVSYKISQRDSEQATAIQTAVEEAVDGYISEIGTTLGESSAAINPEMLAAAMYKAGAASVTITAPVYTSLAEYEVAKCTSKTVTYNGILS